MNRAVADAAAGRQLFVNAVDDPANASAFLGGVVRRAGVTVAISTDGAAPAIAGLLREGIDALLPEDLDAWMAEAARQREAWRAGGVPMDERRPRLLEALNRLYEAAASVGKVVTKTVMVSLVGAGPGDPELLTRKAAARLRRADLVLYDALVDERVLRAGAAGRSASSSASARAATR